MLRPISLAQRKKEKALPKMHTIRLISGLSRKARTARSFVPEEKQRWLVLVADC